MWFLSVGPEICLQLPSDSTSRWTPLLFGYTLPTIWACSGLTPVRARPWRANWKKRLFFTKETLHSNHNIKFFLSYLTKMLEKQFKFSHPYSQLLVAWKHFCFPYNNQAGLLTYRSSCIALFPAAQWVFGMHSLNTVTSSYRIRTCFPFHQIWQSEVTLPIWHLFVSLSSSFEL